MAEELSTGAKCIKYGLFIFNLLFLLVGLALIVVGAVIQVQSQSVPGHGQISAAGIFLIVIGGIIFVVCFFGCAGAINNNHCMVVTFGVLLVLLLLTEIAIIITGFVMKDKVRDYTVQALSDSQVQFNSSDATNVATKFWMETQQQQKCCGSNGSYTWDVNEDMRSKDSVPDSCCKNVTKGCGKGKLSMPGDSVHQKGCVGAVEGWLKQYALAVGAVAAAAAIIQLIGIIFAFCLANSLRKDYRVV